MWYDNYIDNNGEIILDDKAVFDLLYQGTDLTNVKCKRSEDLEIYNSIIDDYDFIADCSDNIETRLSINDTCIKYKKTWVMAAVGGFFGQIATFQSIKNNTSNSTYRDLMKHKIFDEAGCDNIGTIGSVVGAVGGMQATEILKLIIGNKENLVNKILIFDFITFQSKTLRINSI